MAGRWRPWYVLHGICSLMKLIELMVIAQWNCCHSLIFHQGYCRRMMVHLSTDRQLQVYLEGIWPCLDQWPIHRQRVPSKQLRRSIQRPAYAVIPRSSWPSLVPTDWSHPLHGRCLKCYRHWFSQRLVAIQRGATCIGSQLEQSPPVSTCSSWLAKEKKLKSVTCWRFLKAHRVYHLMDQWRWMCCVYVCHFMSTWWCWIFAS